MLFDAGKVHHKFVNLQIFEKNSDYAVTAKVTCEANTGKTDCEKLGEEIKKKPVFEFLIRSVFEATRTQWMEKMNEQMKLAKAEIDVPFENYYGFLAKHLISISRGFDTFKRTWKNPTEYKDGRSGQTNKAYMGEFPATVNWEISEESRDGMSYKFILKLTGIRLVTMGSSGTLPETFKRELKYQVTVTVDDKYNMAQDGSSIKWKLLEPTKVAEFTDPKQAECDAADSNCDVWKGTLIKMDDGLLNRLPNIVKSSAKKFYDEVRNPMLNTQE